MYRRIITVTFNPAIDKSIYDDKISFDIGGKGINVSKVLKSMNTDSLCVGLIGKENKNIIYDGLDRLNIDYRFIEVDGKVRTNTKRIINNELYEENEKGPQVTKDKVDELLNMITQFNNDIVVISGSVPDGVDENIYAIMTRILKENNNYVIVDCDKGLLKNVVKEKPHMIKPNIREICNLFDCEYDEDRIIEKVRELEIDDVLISKGSDGAILISDKVYSCKPLSVRYKNALSAGDAMVAAFAYSKLNDMNKTDALKLSMAAAAACVESDGSKPGDYQRTKQLLKEVEIEIL